MRGDVREVLQYVPLFAGRTFVVVFDEGLLPEPAVAETLLDLISLQRIGVKLVIVVVGGDLDDLSDWAVEMEFKSEVIPGSLSEGDALATCQAILARGQAALLNGAGCDVLGPEIGELASGLEAAKLMVLLNEPPEFAAGRTIPAIAASQVTDSGLLGKAARICQSGVPRVHLLDGRMHGALTAEIFSNEGVGTMVHADSYRAIKPLSEEDIPELLAMMGRSIRAAHLVPRSYEEIEAKADDFLLLHLDDNVVGSVAVHSYANDPRRELACLYVKLSHEGHGYGGTLIEAAEQKARGAGAAGIFALTNRAADFFATKGYRRGEMADLPEARRRQLEASGRESEVWLKDF